MMGLIARFHRKSVPSENHEECRELSTKDLGDLLFLSGIVRLAAALDRTRQNRVRQIDAHFEKNNTTIELHFDPAYVPEVELHKANLERNAIEKSFSTKLKIVLRGP
jgi:exopolyphosphatase/guanosine-5'-triphosphate,3'-diphosphate pyrophosphatase